MFYTYLWLRYDGTPYYVGKGKKNRAFVAHSAGNKLKPPSREKIILQEWPNEVDAYEAERLLIYYYGRIDLGTGCLRNLTSGGEGSDHWKGKQRSEATLKKMSKPHLKSRKTVCTHGHQRVPGAGKCLTCQKEYNAARYPQLQGMTKEQRREHKTRALSDSHKGKVPWNKGVHTNLTPWNKDFVGYRLKTHCTRGHERTPENTDRWRACITCARMKNEKRNTNAIPQ
jgi:hypothetical protein